MAEMKFKFTVQPYQTEAVENVAEVFAGQPFHDRISYRRDVGVEKESRNDPRMHLERLEEDYYLGYANAKIALSAERLLENIRAVQSRSNIHLSSALTSDMGACSLDVEMETGTGKTYVYIKTMFELNRRYGWSKFIVVVPSVAIREGVRKSFETMQDHFMEHYGKKARAFVYDSKNLTDIDDFSKSADIEVMIINMQNFNTNLKEGGTSKEARIINSVRDDFSTRRPIDVIAANRPIVVLDEPQKMGGSATQAGIKRFNPLFCLNYSATHKHHHETVYVLDALDAYNKRLVKRIEVKGFDIRNLHGTGRYLYLSRIDVFPNKPPEARIEFEIRRNDAVKRETRRLKKDDDLYPLSNEMEQYKGYRISDVDPQRRLVTFTNGEAIRAGEVAGDESEKNLRRVQIRETIRSHFEKEKELFERGIKTLSLFFIDEVAKYRKYDDEGNEINSEYGEIFEQEYNDVLKDYLTLSDTPYEPYLRQIDVHSTHAGYFSIDKKTRRIINSEAGKNGESEDVAAYDLILKDKERLLSFDNPVRFIFSHSALREGWDNPNVFQICTLRPGGDDPTRKRQEVGRGLRLCVNQNGDRMDWDVLGSEVQQVNRLTVIASGGYKDFVEGLQRGIREDLYERPTKATQEYFAGKTLLIDGRNVTITKDQANDIHRYLIKNDYIDRDDHVTDKYRADAANETLAPVPESCADIAGAVHALMQAIFDEHALDDMIEDGNGTKIQENPLNDNFYKKEFQALWDYINHKYAYTVEFDSKELIDKAVRRINENMYVTKLQYTVTEGQQERDLDREKLERGEGFVAEKTQTHELERSGESSVRYDLVGKIAEGAKLTRKSAAEILRRISPHAFAMFKDNPEEFITKAVRFIKEQKATMIVEHISYNRTEGTYDSSIFTAQKNADFAKAYRAKKNVQDYVFTDGYAKDGRSVERRFAEDMDMAKEVCVYAKLPRTFSIPTPVGDYSPDWAIAFHKGTVKHIYFIAETKGTMDSMNLKAIEKAKIDCAKELFRSLSDADVVYDSVDSYQHLLEIMEKY